MGKVQSGDVEEYFSVHLPYKARILVTHYRMSRTCWNRDAGQLDACFIAALVTGRLFLNTLGIGKKGGALIKYAPKQNSDDVMVSALGGTEVDLGNIDSREKAMLLGFIVMADKADDSS